MCNAHTFAFGPARADIFARKLIEGPLGRAHRRPAILDLYFGTGLLIRKKARNSKWATAGGRYHHDMFKTYPANVDSSTYLCDVTSNDRERFFRKQHQKLSEKLKELPKCRL